MMRNAWPLLFLSVVACSAPPRPITVGEFIAQKEGVSVAEGERRAAHQNALHGLIARASADPAWGGLRFEHRPTYRVVLSFTDGQPRPELVALAPSDLRPHIVFEKAVRSRAEADRLMNVLSTALQPLGGDWNISFDPANGRFTVNVARKKQIEPARALVPEAMRSDVDVVVGPQIIPT